MTLSKINPNLIPYRVMLHEEKGDKFQIAFDCQAVDDDHAVEQAENAYPGCEVESYLPFDDNSVQYVIYSPNESAVSDGVGFWSNEDGWTTVGGATKFSYSEKSSFNLPISTGQDARWVLWTEAESHYAEEELRSAGIDTLSPAIDHLVQRG